MYKQTMRSSAFKQTATAGGSEEGKEIKTTVDAKVTEKKKNYAKDEQVCSAEYKAKNGKGGPGSKECQAWKDTSSEQKKKASTTTTETCLEGSTKDANGKCVKITKEDGLDYEGTLQTAKYGKVLEPWEINRQKRGTRKATNERNQASRRLDRNDGAEFKDGKYVLKSTASAKERRKFNKENDRYNQADDTVKNQGLARESGGTAGDSYYKGDRDRGLGEQADPDQKSQFKREAVKTNKAAKEKAAIEAAKKTAQDETEQQTAEVENVTTGQSGRAIGANEAAAIEPGAGPGGMFDVGAFAPTDYSKILQGNSALQKKGYKQKAKSVATRKLQGAQGKLPSHLQASIKAAPERTVLKKSYFKNK
tara:strand:+ start:545 stop:1636 length:1092 start_codon:yes stop_codon:yes gene_type:complete